VRHTGQGVSFSARLLLVTILIACAPMVLGAPLAMGAGGATTGSNPAEPLWRAYPLEQTATTAKGSAVPSTNSTHRASSKKPALAPGRRTPWIAYVLSVAAVALSVATLAVLHRRSKVGAARAGLFGALEQRGVPARPRATLPAAGRAGRKPQAGRRRGAEAALRGAVGADQPPATAARDPQAPAGSVDAPESRTAASEQSAAAPAPAQVLPRATADSPAGAEGTAAAPEAVRGAPGPGVAAADSSPGAPDAVPEAPAESTAVSDAPEGAAEAPERSAARADADAAPPAPAPSRSPQRGGAAGTRKATTGPICQIRWLPRGRGSCFSAVTTDDDGVDRTVATSPRLEWRAPTPPEQSPEAQAALRRLAKTLRDDGWRPMRTKGKDFNEPRWYARRFRYREAPAEADLSVASGQAASASSGPPRASRQSPPR
jgi:hypothetical protein